MITPHKIDITIYQGANYYKAWELRDSDGDPIDLSGWSAEAHIRAKVKSPDIILLCDTDNGKLFIDQTVEYTRIGFDLDEDDTKLLTMKDAVYDIKLIDSTGAVARIQEGIITISPAVTRRWELP